MVDLTRIESFDTGIPTDTPPAVSDDPLCQVCGAGLTYSGRGRKPKFCDEHKTSSGSPRKQSSGGSSVDAAMASLEFFEDLFTIPLLMMSPTAAQEWVKNLGPLRVKNRAILAGNPQLCKSIAKTSSKVSPYMLLGSYGYALAPVAKTVLNDMRVKKERAAADAESMAAWNPPEGFAPNVVDIDDVLKRESSL